MLKIQPISGSSSFVFAILLCLVGCHAWLEIDCWTPARWSHLRKVYACTLGSLCVCSLSFFFSGLIYSYPQIRIFSFLRLWVGFHYRTEAFSMAVGEILFINNIFHAFLTHQNRSFISPTDIFFYSLLSECECYLRSKFCGAQWVNVVP